MSFSDLDVGRGGGRKSSDCVSHVTLLRPRRDKKKDREERAKIIRVHITLLPIFGAKDPEQRRGGKEGKDG